MFSFRRLTTKAQQKFCGPNCCIYGIYSILFVLFLILVGLTIWFINYGQPLMQNGMDFQDSLVGTKCYLTKYDIQDCNYQCYKCDDIINCDDCNGPWCSI